jgi:ribosomal protein L40E
MAVQASPRIPSQALTEKRVKESEVQISYFVKKQGGKPSRICLANLLDISNAGLCMEISDLDSELYMESGGRIFLLNRNIDMQIFCRSYPDNVSIQGHVKWIQHEDETSSPQMGEESSSIRVGVLFRFDDAGQRLELANLVRLLKTDTTNCNECNAPVSVDAPLCYNCGSRLVRRRAFLRKILDNLLAGK